jgi:hypothetical protein
MERGVGVAVAVGLYLAGVSAALLAVFYRCARCQQDNAYLGLSSLELLLIPLAGALIASGLVVALGYPRWLVPAVVVGVGVVWFLMLDWLRYPLATAAAEVIVLGGGAQASFWLGGFRTLAAALGAAVLVFLLTELRGPQEWAVGIGVDGLVVLMALGLGFTVAWVSRKSRRPRGAGARARLRP